MRDGRVRRAWIGDRRRRAAAAAARARARRAASGRSRSSRSCPTRRPQRAGLRAEDLILAVDGEPVAGVDDLHRLIGRRPDRPHVHAHRRAGRAERELLLTPRECTSHGGRRPSAATLRPCGRWPATGGRNLDPGRPRDRRRPTSRRSTTFEAVLAVAASAGATRRGCSGSTARRPLRARAAVAQDAVADPGLRAQRAPAERKTTVSSPPPLRPVSVEKTYSATAPSAPPDCTRTIASALPSPVRSRNFTVRSTKPRAGAQQVADLPAGLARRPAGGRRRSAGSGSAPRSPARRRRRQAGGGGGDQAARRRSRLQQLVLGRLALAADLDGGGSRMPRAATLTA